MRSPSLTLRFFSPLYTRSFCAHDLPYIHTHIVQHAQMTRSEKKYVEKTQIHSSYLLFHLIHAYTKREREREKKRYSSITDRLHLKEAE